MPKHKSTEPSRGWHRDRKAEHRNDAESETEGRSALRRETECEDRDQADEPQFINPLQEIIVQVRLTVDDSRKIIRSIAEPTEIMDGCSPKLEPLSEAGGVMEVEQAQTQRRQ